MIQTLDVLQRAISVSRQLQEIVRTMKVLAAVSIRQYERAVASLEQYGHTVELGLVGVLRRAPLPPRRPPAGGRAAIVFGSDQGLCGRFNETLVDLVQTSLGEGRGVRILAIGARADMGLEACGLKVEECFFVPGSVAGITSTVRQILEKIETWRGEGIGTVDLFHHRSHGRGRYRPVQLRLLPLEEAWLRRLGGRAWPGRSLPCFTMAPPALLAALLRQYLFVSLYRGCAESLAAEHGQRLLSMQSAERNIERRIERLTRTYQQLRQEQITAELLEVVTGFQALEEEDHGRA